MEYFGLYVDYEPSNMEGVVDPITNTVYFNLNISDKIYLLQDVLEFISLREAESRVAGYDKMFIRFNLDADESFDNFSLTLRLVEMELNIPERKVKQRLYTRHSYEYFEWQYDNDDDLEIKLPLNVGFEQDRINKRL